MTSHQTIVRVYFNLHFRDCLKMKDGKGATKAHQKLVKLATKAELCVDRKEAQKLIRKADKAHAKLSN